MNSKLEKPGSGSGGNVNLNPAATTMEAAVIDESKPTVMDKLLLRLALVYWCLFDDLIPRDVDWYGV
ncbi:hypothetical protein V6N11_020081 [Hibiscus sabdariffa]|uniref:Uncharacterized protein n=1 Tax=Hibiscus sabdariffa TaxID=183260 RepID=A0ABR2P911_9ROSI